MEVEVREVGKIDIKRSLFVFNFLKSHKEKNFRPFFMINIL